MALAGLVAAALASAPATGESRGEIVPMPYVLACAAVEELEAALRANGERMAARGEVLGGGPFGQVAFWVNATSQEWSVVLIDADRGMACLAVAGTRFKPEKVPPSPPARERGT